MKKKISKYRLFWTLRKWKIMLENNAYWPVGFEEVYRELRKLIHQKKEK